MATLADKALGTLIRVQEGATDVNYELAGYNVHGAGTATLVRKNAQATARQMHNTAIDFYGQTTMDAYLNQTLYGTFPANLKKYIQLAPITCYSTSSAYEVLNRKCFLLSLAEIGAVVTGYVANENSQLGLYTGNALRIKTNEANGAAIVWWVRSRAVVNTGVYGAVGTGGATVTSGAAASNSNSVVPAFALPSSRPLLDEPNPDGSYNLSYAEYIDIDVPMGSLTDMPKAIRTMLQYQGQITALYACNNYNDSSPTWEAILDNAEHAFTNTTKTAGQWAVAVRVTIEREASEEIFLNEFPAIVRC